MIEYKVDRPSDVIAEELRAVANKSLWPIT
jgi:hypothetical protein